MSLYNGFLSHQQQLKYYQLVKYLVIVLQKRLLKFYQEIPCDQSKFTKIVSKINSNIYRMEWGKHSEPKFSGLMDDLLLILNPDYRQKNSSLSEFNPCSRISNSLSLTPKAHLLSKQVLLPNQRLGNNNKTMKIESKSLQSIQPQKAIQQYQQDIRYSMKTLQSRVQEFKSLRRFNPPKVGDFIERLRRDQKANYRPERLLTVHENQQYIGQRRKKTKKTVKDIYF